MLLNFYKICQNINVHIIFQFRLIVSATHTSYLKQQKTYYKFFLAHILPFLETWNF